MSVSQLDFNANTIDEIENGITIADGTVLGVTIANEAAGSALTGFQITMGSYLGQATIEGDGGNSMPLDILELTATNFAGFGGGTLFFGPIALDAASQVIVTSNETSTDWTTHQIGITYSLGTDPANSLIQYESGYYSVEIDFILEPVF